MAVGYRATCSSRPYSVPSGFREKMSCKTPIFSSSHSSIKNKTRPWIREMLSHLIINLYANYGHCFTLVALAVVGHVAPLSVPQNPPVLKSHSTCRRIGTMSWPKESDISFCSYWTSESVFIAASPQGPGPGSASVCGQDKAGVLLSGGIERLAFLCCVYTLYLIIERPYVLVFNIAISN